MKPPSRWLLWICTGALLVRLLMLFAYGHDARFTHDDDSREYLLLAENMIQGHGFSLSMAPPYEPDSFRTPGYPLFLVLVRTAFGSYNAALVLQIAFALFTAYYAYSIGTLFQRTREGLWAAAIFLFMPFSILVSLRFLTQTGFTLILVAALYYWIRFMQTQRMRFFWIVAMLLPAAAYIRPIGQWLYIPLIIAYGCAVWQGGRKHIIRAVGLSLVLVIMFLAVLAPWLYRNERLFGHFALSSVQPYQLYFYDAPAILAQAEGVSYATARTQLEHEAQRFASVKRFYEYTTFRYGSELTHNALQVIAAHPIAFVIVRAKLLVSFFTRDGIRYWFEYWYNDGLQKAIVLRDFYSFDGSAAKHLFAYSVLLERLWLWFGVAGMLAAIWHAWKKDRNVIGGYLSLFAVIAYFALLSGAVSSAGLRYPVEPLIWLLACFGYSQWYRYLV